MQAAPAPAGPVVLTAPVATERENPDKWQHPTVHEALNPVDDPTLERGCSGGASSEPSAHEMYEQAFADANAVYSQMQSGTVGMANLGTRYTTVCLSVLAVPQTVDPRERLVSML